MSISDRVAAALQKHGRLMIDGVNFVLMVQNSPDTYLVVNVREYYITSGDFRLTNTLVSRGKEEKFLQIFVEAEGYSEEHWKKMQEKYLKMLEDTGIVRIAYAE